MNLNEQTNGYVAVNSLLLTLKEHLYVMQTELIRLEAEGVTGTLMDDLQERLELVTKSIELIAEEGLKVVDEQAKFVGHKQAIEEIEEEFATRSKIHELETNFNLKEDSHL
tara:strand:- start:107 stop:439 length:333 start_codon:yes stop_codon:yes gene_type:complete